jgi:hypothetical protein
MEPSNNQETALKKHKTTGAISRLAVSMMLLVVLITSAASGEGPYVLDWSTIDGGGGQSSSGPYTLTGTIGQPDAAYSAGGQYELLGGFWPGGPLCFVDFYSFARFAEQWLYTGPGLAADLHEDNIVDKLDLKVFADEWLYSCPYNWQLK